MTEPDPQNPSPPQSPEERLRRAVDLLDEAFEAGAAEASAQRLAEARGLDAARAEIAELRRTRQALAKRLDAAIGRIRAVLGN